MARLSGKTALITGAALGIGRACAWRMAESGAAIALLDVRDAEGEALAAELVAAGHRARYWHADVADEASVAAAIDAAAVHFGGLQVLVNNAGIAGEAAPTDATTIEAWERVMAINARGVMLCTKHAIPHLRRAGGGSIVNLSSIAGLVATSALAPYHASKGAVRMLTKHDAVLYAPEGIRVNGIHPGYIWTPMVEAHLRAAGGDLEAAKAAAGALHPLGRMGQPDDIAWAVVYLASDESGFVTGAELVVDGGYTAR